VETERFKSARTVEDRDGENVDKWIMREKSGSLHATAEDVLGRRGRQYQQKDALWELGDKKEYDNTDEHRCRVVALARLGLGLVLRRRRQDVALAAGSAQQPLTALALAADGED